MSERSPFLLDFMRSPRDTPPATSEAVAACAGLGKTLTALQLQYGRHIRTVQHPEPFHYLYLALPDAAQATIERGGRYLRRWRSPYFLEITRPEATHLYVGTPASKVPAALRLDYTTAEVVATMLDMETQSSTEAYNRFVQTGIEECRAGERGTIIGVLEATGLASYLGSGRPSEPPRTSGFGRGE